MRFAAIAALISLALAVATSARAEEKVVELPTRPGVTQAFLGTPVQGTPVATVILLPGSPGTLSSNATARARSSATPLDARALRR
jgi:hypothetical protein